MRKRLRLLFLGVCASCVAAAAAAASLLPEGARLAIVGDSITEQKLYSKYMETYLLACAGRTDIHVFQFGWSGERADGFASRAANDLGMFKPTVVTTCYGMNDGQYRPYTEDIGRAYEASTRKYVEILKGMGVKHIVLGSPGAVDTRYFVRNNFAPLSGAEGYNQNLGKLRDINRRLAGELGVAFADVHQPMLDAMAKAKAALGDDYDVCGRDGFHPGPNGHLIMAYAFLRALGCDGRVAELTLDLQGAPQVSAGHKVAGGGRNQVELESTRYPFCFDPDPKASSSTRSIAPYFPFNEELNRFVLKVRNLNAPKARVTWGATSLEFTREQLEAGVNLAAAFPATPFDEAFRKVMDAVGQKQNFETLMIKEMVTKFRFFGRETAADPALAEAFRQVGARLVARQEALDAAVRQALTPVRHTLSVTPVTP
ncbi:SGNH/GDSL hydrolase family protein [Fontisphaera persica]|uniref:SGNH/GDSL hydrolase family protein n=1 Tax=Fontisphaera persica TaxID=2974023 RepID=UPI0024C08C97|nr:SGNH/GDSL hydrolase family protein [Fontisphaera persica]WCJ59040.1 SGNH/GDSL hydrolase family protein [Fontisphaera persica]